MVENNSLEGCVNSRLEFTVVHGYGDCLVPAGPPLARIASERDDATAAVHSSPAASIRARSMSGRAGRPWSVPKKAPKRSERRKWI